MSVTGLRNASAPSPKQGCHGDGSDRSHAKSHDYSAYRLVCSAFQAVAGRGHDGIRDTHSGRDGGHRFIDLGARSKRNYPPADTARDVLMSAFGTKTDIPIATMNVRFRVQSGHWSDILILNLPSF